MKKKDPPKDENEPMATCGELDQVNNARPAMGELVPVDQWNAREQEHRERTDLAVAEFGEGLPWQPEHYEAEIRSEMRRGCESFLRAGRLLLVARECATHGEWGTMLGRLNMEPRLAHRMMEAARRIAAISNRSTSTDLVNAAKSQGKLIELLSLPEEQFAELAETGETNGLSIDDIHKMSVRELRSAVKNARDDLTTKDDRAATREREIERLNTELRKARRQFDQATPDDVLETLKVEVIKAVATVTAPICIHDETRGLNGALAALHAHMVEHGGGDAHWVMAQLDEVKRQISELQLNWSAAV